MHPVICDFGKWTIRSYDAVLCAAIITGIVIVWREARRKGYPAIRLAVCLIGTVVCAILGARINGWLFWFRGYPERLNLNLFSTTSGMTAFGGIAGAFGFVALYSWINHWKILEILDIVAPVLALTEGIQRVGCLLNGCCFGRETRGFFGFYMPNTLGYWAYRYPSQIITGIFCIVLFAWLWSRRRKIPFRGALILYYLVVYDTGRIALDFLRGDEPSAFGFLTAHQATAAVFAIIAAIILYFRLGSNTSGSKITEPD